MPKMLPRKKAQFKPRVARNCTTKPRPRSLDFRVLHGEGFERKFFMRSPFNHFCSLSIFPVLTLVFASCQEDVRYSGQAQYLGGIYGNQPTSGAPTDNVSYWDGDHIGGKPSVKISLKEQRAYFYKNNMLVGISQLSTGREGLNTPLGKFSIISKDINHASSRYGDYVDDAGNVVMPNVDVQKDKKPPYRSEEHTSELQSQSNIVCRLLLEKNK